MKIFQYSGKKAKKLSELTAAQKVHIVHYLTHELPSDGGVITRKHEKKFSCSSELLTKLNGMDVKDVMGQGKNVDPRWSGDEFIFHPEPNPAEFTFFEPNYDSVHVGSHLEWTEDDVKKLFTGCLESALETLRDSVIGSNEDSYTNALNYIKSDVNRVFCRHVGIDHEELCDLAVYYKEIHDKYNASQRNQKAAPVDSEDELESICEDDYDYASLIDEQDNY